MLIVLDAMTYISIIAGLVFYHRVIPGAELYLYDHTNWRRLHHLRHVTRLLRVVLVFGAAANWLNVVDATVVIFAVIYLLQGAACATLAWFIRFPELIHVREVSLRVLERSKS